MEIYLFERMHNFCGIDMSHSTIKGTKDSNILSNCTFLSCKLSNVVFDCDLINPVFDDCQLENVTFLKPASITVKYCLLFGKHKGISIGSTFEDCQFTLDSIDKSNAKLEYLENITNDYLIL